MERLTVSNFLVIKHAEFDVGSINVIIGHQANGKSIIAKLLYYFKDFLSSTFINSIHNLETKRELQKNALKVFESYFPRYTWNDQYFEISYLRDDIEISIKKSKGKKGTSTLKLDYSSSLTSLHRKLKNSYKRKVDEYELVERDYRTRSRDPFWGLLDELLTTHHLGHIFNRSLFIPASRSFFANLQKNVFSFLASNIEIDPFIKNFGSQYESAKRFAERSFTRARVNPKYKKEVDDLVEQILVGKYKYEDELDWIEYKNKKINLANASSGQQEALPMLLILSSMSYYGPGAATRTFFIEEPEAHLFPVSQKHIMSLIALLYNKSRQSFVITTHSPYILTAINNMILAHDLKSKSIDQYNKNIDIASYALPFNEVKAYTFSNGIMKSIIDEDMRLIGSSVIDSVSDCFEKEFDTLMTALQD